MSLGEKLRSLRHRTKRTLREQGRLFNVSMNSIYRWEHDLSIPRRPVLNVIANYYNVPIDWLLTEESEPTLISESEQNLLGMFRRLPDNGRYQVMGYIERMSCEEIVMKS